MKRIRWRSAAGFITAMTIASLIGSVTGTVAWYAYSTEATVSVYGVTIYNAEQLQLGLTTNEYVQIPTTMEDHDDGTGDSSYHEYLFATQRGNTGYGWSTDMYNKNNTNHLEIVSLADRRAYKLSETDNSIVGKKFAHYELDKDTALANEISEEDFNKIPYSEYIESDTDNDGYFDTVYWFIKEGNNLTPETIESYMNETGKSDARTLHLATSNRFSSDPSLNHLDLHRAPEALEDRDQAEQAQQEEQVILNLCFRVFSVSATEDSAKTYLPNKPIWLTDATPKAITLPHPDTPKDSSNAVRIYFEGEDRTNEDKTVLFAPNYQDSGKTVIGGVLDLDNDGIYDWEYNPDTRTRQEHIYGYKDGMDLVTPLKSGNDHPDEVWDNINKVKEFTFDNNGVRDTREPLKDVDYSTFIARHGAGVAYYVNPNDTAGQYEGITFGTASYQGINEVIPTDARRTQNGVEDSEANASKILTMTADSPEDSRDAIATLNTVMWLEGWDHTATNAMAEYEFQLGLTFEISKSNREV